MMKIDFHVEWSTLISLAYWIGGFSTRWLRLSVNFWPRSILRGEIMPWMWILYKYQVLSSELFHHFPFVLLLLPSDVLQIFLSANSGTPENWLFVDVCSEWGKGFKILLIWISTLLPPSWSRKTYCSPYFGRRSLHHDIFAYHTYILMFDICWAGILQVLIKAFKSGWEEKRETIFTRRCYEFPCWRRSWRHYHLWSRQVLNRTLLHFHFLFYSSSSHCPHLAERKMM